MFRQITVRLTFVFIILGFFVSLSLQNALAKESSLLNQDNLNKAIRLHIEKNMPWPADTMRFEVLSRLPGIALTAEKMSWKVDTKENEKYLGDSYLVLKLYNNGVLFKEESIKVRIEILREFVVSANGLTRDSIISNGDVIKQKKWVRSISLNSVSNVDEVVGKLIGVSIRPNTEITRNMLKEVTAVKRGKMVQVVLESGAINITTMGLSEEDGAEGTFVRVRNVTSNKIIYARVIGQSRVRVDF